MDSIKKKYEVVKAQANFNTYANYVYLFSSKEEINFLSSPPDKEVVKLSDGTLSLILASVSTEKKIDPKIVYGDIEKELPNIENSTQRLSDRQTLQDSELLDLTTTATHESLSPKAKPQYFSLDTVDLIQNPLYTHLFDFVDATGPVYNYNKPVNANGRAHIINFSTPNPDGADDDWQITFTPLSPNQRLEASKLAPFNDPDKKKFNFKQEISIGYVASQLNKNYQQFNKKKTGATPLLQEAMASYFMSLNSKVYTENTSTAFGVPYDFQTLLFDDSNIKSQGVTALKQPKYDKIYNYFDGDYEPTLPSLINNDIIDERMLYSIYDFLYLKQQPKLAFFLKSTELSLQDTSLAAFNRYTDSLSRMYDEYSGKDKVTIEGLSDFLTKNAAAATPANQGKLFDILFAAQMGASPFEMKMQAVQMIEEWGQDGYTEQEGFSKDYEDFIDVVKSKGNPQWLSELKTGIYFSENSLELFNEALDEDPRFPFFIKINLPVEGVGPITRALKEANMLDYINTYAANQTIPQKQTEELATYSNWYGGILNGAETTSFNVLYDLSLNGFRIFFDSRKEQDISEAFGGLEEQIEEFKKQKTIETLTAIGAKLESKSYDDIDKLYSAVKTALDFAKPLIDAYETYTKDQTGLYTPQFADEMALYRRALIDIEHTKVQKKYEYLVNPHFNTLLSNAYKIGLAIDKIFDYVSTTLPLKPDGTKSEKPWLKAVLNYNESQSKRLEMGEAITILKQNDNEILKGYFIDQEKKTYAAAGKFIDAAAEEKFGELQDITAAVSKTVGSPTYDSDIYLNDIGKSFENGVLVYQQENDELVGTISPLGKLLKQLKTVSLKEKLYDTIIDGNLLRGPAEINDGQFAHQETLMYEIAKYRVNAEGEETYIQSIFLPACDQQQISYYDTQVIPHQDYFYRIYTHKIVVGTRYKQIPYNVDTHVWFKDEGLLENPNAGRRIKLLYDVEPFLQVVRVPYYNTRAVNVSFDKFNLTRIEDKPPLPPQINFVPFRNVDDRVLILVENSSGEIEQYPRVIFEDTDMPIFNEVYLSQDRIPGDKMIFKSDDYLGTYQIYRLETPPEDYTSFANTSNEEILELFALGSDRNDSVVDAIVPNKDYYYTARFQDIHGKLSNPTEVFKLNMVHQKGAMPYLTTEVIDLKEVQKDKFNENFSAVKEMQKYLYIQPNYLQTDIFVNDAPVEGENYITYSTAKLLAGAKSDGETMNVFGKKFKFRITSKQTGKKLDINLTVKELAEITNNE